MDACAEDKQACLHSNSCDAHTHLRDTPISKMKVVKSDIIGLDNLL